MSDDFFFISLEGRKPEEYNFAYFKREQEGVQAYKIAREKLEIDDIPEETLSAYTGCKI
ncbi:MAG: hypothetical protein ABJL35_03575 [Parasphingorhabdus sp.]|uniref:hypothetical protein n=1 Tax=Parasphingorhabdus sp. TaxID=2709688 RepID=UPI0032939722